jgi:hypothetical protein
VAAVKLSELMGDPQGRQIYMALLRNRAASQKAFNDVAPLTETAHVIERPIPKTDGEWLELILKSV